MKKTIIGLGTALALQLSAEEPAPPTYPYWHDAWRIAKSHQPEIAAASNNILRAELNVSVSGAWDNPSLEFEIEGIDGEEEQSVRIRQPLPFGGKIRATRSLAQAEAEVAQEASATLLLDLARSVADHALDVWRWQELTRLRSAHLGEWESFKNTASARVKGGLSIEVEASKANISTLAARNARSIAVRELKAAHSRLQLLCGPGSSNLISMIYLTDEVELPSKAQWDSFWNKHPMMRSVQAERRRAFAEAGANAAETSSEVALTAGATEDEEGEVAYQAAIEIELPLWRSRKTAKKERGYGERQAELHAERAERDLQLRADASWSHINLKAHRYEVLTEELIPAHQKLLAQARAAYEAGSLDYLELTDAVSGLQAFKEERTELRVELERALFDWNFVSKEMSR